MMIALLAAVLFVVALVAFRLGLSAKGAPCYLLLSGVLVCLVLFLSVSHLLLL